MKYFFLILAVVLLFFFPVFSGLIPFPGDLLVNENPYKTESFQGYGSGSFPNKAQGEDVITQIYPWRYFSVQQLKQGQIPYWNPYNFSGNQQLANFQTAVFYPFNLLYLVSPFNMAWTLIIMLSPFLAAVFMFAFLRKSLSLSKFAAFIGGIVFAFSSYMTVWIEYGNIGHTILWLPLSLFFTKKFSQKITALNFVSLVLLLSLSILAGYIQGVFYIYLMSFFYFLFLLKTSNSKQKVNKIVLFTLALILPLLITSFQILPTLYLFLNSTRGQYSMSQISNLLLPIYYWVTAFASDFFGNPATRNYWISGTYIERVMYVGVAVLFFALIATKAKVSEKKFFIISAIISLFVATNIPLIKFLYLIPIPVISTTVPTRELSLFIFSVTVLGAIGIDQWEKIKIKTRIPLFFILVYVSLFLIAFFLGKQIALKNLLLPTFFALSTVFIFYFLQKKNIGKIFLTLIIIADLLYFFNKITPFSKEELIYPKTAVVSFLSENAGINRFWGLGSAYIKPNFQTYDKTYSPEGNDALHIELYGALLASTKDGKIPAVLPRPDANLAPGFGSSLADNLYRKRLLDLLGVKYILHQNSTGGHDETFPKDKYSLAWQKAPWQIYENKGALPRFFMAGDYRVYKNKSDVLKNIYNKDLNLGKVLLLESKPDIQIDKNSKGSVQLLSYSPNKIVFTTKNSGNSLLFLSDSYYPQWEVSIDGKTSKILVADYTFRAVAVPKGEHRIEFLYSPFFLTWGIKLSLISIGLLSVIIFLLKVYEKR